MNGAVHMTAQIKAESHKRLTDLAKNRSMPLNLLTAAILEWAAGKDVHELIRFGVRLPVYPDELKQSGSES